MHTCHNESINKTRLGRHDGSTNPTAITMSHQHKLFWLSNVASVFSFFNRVNKLFFGEVDLDGELVEVAGYSRTYDRYKYCVYKFVFESDFEKVSTWSAVYRLDVRYKE